MKTNPDSSANDSLRHYGNIPQAFHLLEKLTLLRILMSSLGRAAFNNDYAISRQLPHTAAQESACIYFHLESLKFHGVHKGLKEFVSQTDQFIQLFQGCLRGIILPHYSEGEKTRSLLKDSQIFEEFLKPHILSSIY